jgi:TatD DNase family protein
LERLIDTHAHLDEIEDLEETIAAARAAGVTAVIAIGSGDESNQKVLDFSRAYKDFVYPALGLHPWNLKEVEIERTLEFIRANSDKSVGIGEIGLDYHKRVRAVAEKDIQKRILKELLRIAKECHKPATIHSRYAWRDALDLVEEAEIEKAVFHWYTGTSSVLKDIVRQSYFISATPAVEYHEEHRRAVKEIPLDRLLLETDCPVTYRRGTEWEFESRPADLQCVLRGVAELKGLPEAQIAEVTTGNALKFFNVQRR